MSKSSFPGLDASMSCVVIQRDNVCTFLLLIFAVFIYVFISVVFYKMSLLCCHFSQVFKIFRKLRNVILLVAILMFPKNSLNFMRSLAQVENNDHLCVITNDNKLKIWKVTKLNR